MSGRWTPWSARDALVPLPAVFASAAVFALTHVRTIDGTGARSFDLAGHTVIPGIVGMHEAVSPEMAYRFHART